MTEYYIKDIATSLLVILIIGAGIYYLFRLNRDSIWNNNFRTIWNNTVARVSFVIICFYVAVFLLDSISFPVFKEVLICFILGSQKFYEPLTVASA